MSWQFIESNWKQMRSDLKNEWSRLTDDHLDGINGARDKLAWKIQEAYGMTREHAEMQIKEFEQRTANILP